MSTTHSPSPTGKLPVAALGLLALALGTLQTVVDPALPLLQRELDVGPGDGALVSNAVLVTGAAVAPIAGKLGDCHGGKRVLLRLMVLVAAGGLLAGVAPNLPVLLLGQILQGFMVGALPLSFVLVRKHLPGDASRLGIGVVMALFTGGAMVGTLTAGPIADALSWHWMFALPTIVIIAMSLAVAWLMPDDPPARSRPRIDWPGALLLSGALLVFMVGLVRLTGDGLSAPAAGALLVLVVGLVTAWVTVERRTAEPMVDLRVLARPAVWHACVLTFVITAGFGIVAFLLPQMFALPAEGHGFGFDTTDIGLLLLPGAVAGAVSDSIGGVAGRRFGLRAVITAGAVGTVVTLLTLMAAHGAPWQLVVAKASVAVAAGMATTALLISAAGAVAEEDTGVITSLLVVTRVIGIALGAQTGGAILEAGAEAATGLPSETAFVTALGVAAAVAAVSLVLTRLTMRGARA
ncbi:MFS transporter [Streptomyces phytohabitans]|uniref:MFS transporter n=1 Tax=Streptomyces phytohabitans TaxID=1150371 RepID=UPI00345BC762